MVSAPPRQSLPQHTDTPFASITSTAAKPPNKWSPILPPIVDTRSQIQADISSESGVLDLYRQVDSGHNNAGTLEWQTRVEHMDAGRIKRVLAVNVLGSMLCAREAVRRMSTRNNGRGGAIDVFTLGLAREVAEEGICVNCVRPGIIYTELHAKGGEPGRVDRVKASVPMQRGGQPEEVARAILWLLSDEASYVTGSILDVSGRR